MVPAASFAILVIAALLSVRAKVLAALPIPWALVSVTVPAAIEPSAELAVPSVALCPLTEAELRVATFDFTMTLIRVYWIVPSAAVTLIMKKSPLVIVTGVPVLRAVAAVKLASLSVVPDANFAIFESCAPESVVVKVEVRAPVACAVVKVTEPAVSDPRAVAGVPSVAVCPFTDAALRVATLD